MNIIKVVVLEEDINYVRHIGCNKEKRRPLVLSLISNKTKLLQNEKNFKGGRIFMTQDYDDEMKAKRKDVVKVGKKLNSMGKSAVIRKKGLVVDMVYLGFKDMMEPFKKEDDVSQKEKTGRDTDEGTQKGSSEKILHQNSKYLYRPRSNSVTASK